MILFIVVLLLARPLGATDVYRSVDKDGVVHYSDQPPAPDAKPLKLPPVQVMDPVHIAPERSRRVVPAPRFRLSLVSPAADETFRGDDRRIPVSVRLDLPLPAGHGLLYLLDGRAQNTAPTRALSFTLENAERGEHLVSVLAVDETGREVQRTPPVIVHMKPPALTPARPERAPPGR